MKYLHIIEIEAKEWFDRVNGNSYFSAVVILDDEQILEMPFQYGYGDHFIDMAFKELEKSYIDLFTDLAGKSRTQFCNDNKIKLITSKQENCKKREL
jgi:hypothetical protein